MGRLPEGYQTVDSRVEKFRAEHPLGSITTKVVFKTEGGETLGVAFRATVRTETGAILGTGHGYSDLEDTKDFEKAESVAIGRALKYAGYPAVDEDSEVEETEKPKKVGKGNSLTRLKKKVEVVKEEAEEAEESEEETEEETEEEETEEAEEKPARKVGRPSLPGKKDPQALLDKYKKRRA